jgi:hypothetical protein
LISSEELAFLSPYFGLLGYGRLMLFVLSINPYLKKDASAEVKNGRQSIKPCHPGDPL